MKGRDPYASSRTAGGRESVEALLARLEHVRSCYYYGHPQVYQDRTIARDLARLLALTRLYLEREGVPDPDALPDPDLPPVASLPDLSWDSRVGWDDSESPGPPPWELLRYAAESRAKLEALWEQVQVHGAAIEALTRTAQTDGADS